MSTSGESNELIAMATPEEDRAQIEVNAEMKRVFLIRHGQSIWNAQQRIQGGSSDSVLSRLGQRQGRLLAKRLEAEQLRTIYTSPLLRAFQTAGMISGHKKVSVRQLHGLKEVRLGQWEGKTIDQIRDEDNILYQRWLKSPSRVKIPGAEKISGFKKRVLGAFQSIVKSGPSGPIAVVTHGGVIVQLLCHILGVRFDRFFQTTRIDNCSISQIEHHNTRCYILSVNDTTHLK